MKLASFASSTKEFRRNLIQVTIKNGLNKCLLFLIHKMYLVVSQNTLRGCVSRLVGPSIVLLDSMLVRWLVIFLLGGQTRDSNRLVYSDLFPLRKVEIKPLITIGILLRSGSLTSPISNGLISLKTQQDYFLKRGSSFSTTSYDVISYKTRSGSK